jgi:lactoylglutathione lyase
MRIEHMAVWSPDIEVLRGFYERWFGATSSARYENPSKGFASYFLSFEDGPRLELMQRHDVIGPAGPNVLGYAHLAIALGSDEAVDRQTAAMRAAGVPVVDGPRRTGDGYYESVVVDPDGNRIELTC